VGEVVGAMRLRAADLGGVHADLGGEEVHGPLDGRGGLGPAGAAVGDGGRGVGDHRPGVELDVGDVVHAGASMVRVMNGRTAPMAG
jgi:hypothetical protein